MKYPRIAPAIFLLAAALPCRAAGDWQPLTNLELRVSALPSHMGPLRILLAQEKEKTAFQKLEDLFNAPEAVAPSKEDLSGWKIGRAFYRWEQNKAFGALWAGLTLHRVPQGGPIFEEKVFCAGLWLREKPIDEPNQSYADALQASLEKNIDRGGRVTFHRHWAEFKDGAEGPYPVMEIFVKKNGSYLIVRQSYGQDPAARIKSYTYLYKDVAPKGDSR